jgi:hypothetical protein
MPTMLGTLDLEEAAREAAGNWRRFECFVWYGSTELDDADQWAIVYTHHRDSGLLDQSNAAVIQKALAPFADADEPDVVFESHSHWAVGHIDGFSMRVYMNGGVTLAFRTYHDLAERMDEYPILDEHDYGERELEATMENIALSARSMKDDFDLAEGWEGDVYSWLSEHRSNAVENADDQGGWPEDDDLEAAFEALGYKRSE